MPGRVLERGGGFDGTARDARAGTTLAGVAAAGDGMAKSHVKSASSGLPAASFTLPAGRRIRYDPGADTTPDGGTNVSTLVAAS
jgi:hypothetical protein